MRRKNHIVRICLGIVCSVALASAYADSGDIVTIGTFALPRQHAVLEYYLSHPLGVNQQRKPGSPEWVDISVAELEIKSKRLLAKSGFKDIDRTEIVAFHCKRKRSKEGYFWYYVIELEDPLHRSDKGNWLPIIAILFVDGSEPILKVRSTR